MKYLRRIASFFSTPAQPKTIPKTLQLIEMIDQARRSQYAEEYAKALQLLSGAMDIAEVEYDTRSKVDITLSRADVLIAQDDLETAKRVLNELRQDCEQHGMKAPLSYTLSSLGFIAQRQDDWVQARDYYEKSREIADSIRTDGALGRAEAHLADIYVHEGNASYAIYLLEQAIPKLSRSGDRELLGYFQGQLGLAQIRSGYEQDGMLNIQKGLESALEINHRPQQRALHLLLGEEAIKMANFKRAYQHYLSAILLYPQPPPQTAEYGTALCQISKACLKTQEIPMAKDYAEQALKLAETLANNALIATAKACLGLALHTSSDALPYLRDAARAYENLEADSFYIDILRNLAAIQAKSGDTESAEQYYQQALAKADKMPMAKAQVYSDLATLRANGQQHREAIQQWQQALQYFQEVNQVNYIGRVHCEIAAIYEQLGDGRMAMREYGYALEQLSRVDDTATRGLVLATVASAYSEYGDIESATDFFKESIEIAQRAHNREIEALRRGNYGRLLTLSNQAKQALSQLTRAHRVSEELQLKLQANVILGNLGLTYAAMDDYEAALEHYQTALIQFEALEARLWQAIFEANEADALLMLGRYDEAANKYQSALAKSRLESHAPTVVQALIGQAHLALAQNDFQTAQSKLQEVEPIAKRLQYKRQLALLQQGWSRLYAAQGKLEQAQAAWEEAKQLRNVLRMPLITADWLSDSVED
jgi:tetratricopeptide (TPR) repeat protein